MFPAVGRRRRQRVARIKKHSSSSIFPNYVRLCVNDFWNNFDFVSSTQNGVEWNGMENGIKLNERAVQSGMRSSRFGRPRTERLTVNSPHPVPLQAIGIPVAEREERCHPGGTRHAHSNLIQFPINSQSIDSNSVYRAGGRLRRGGGGEACMPMRPYSGVPGSPRRLNPRTTAPSRPWRKARRRKRKKCASQAHVPTLFNSKLVFHVAQFRYANWDWDLLPEQRARARRMRYTQCGVELAAILIARA